ncbi:hypothetical protein CW304_29315 [Bacillus sp. UFRGS-B20]|nr:hypothetical protein CW304_29315 [Bacillus sp. UFRGS-B20]
MRRNRILFYQSVHHEKMLITESQSSPLIDCNNHTSNLFYDGNFLTAGTWISQNGTVLNVKNCAGLIPLVICRKNNDHTI